jgi:hypothetical protein
MTTFWLAPEVETNPVFFIAAVCSSFEISGFAYQWRGDVSKHFFISTIPTPAPPLCYLFQFSLTLFFTYTVRYYIRGQILDKKFDLLSKQPVINLPSHIVFFVL